MPATDRFQLLLETATRGEAELRRFEQSINRLADVAERSQNRTASSYERTSKRASDALKKTGDDARQFGQRIQDFVSRPLSAAGDAFQELAASGGKATAVMGGIALGVAGASTALFAFVNSAAQGAREVSNFADSTGFSLNQMDRFRAVAKLSNFELTNLNQAAVDLSLALRDTGGQGERTRTSLRELGISFSDSTGKVRPLNSILLETIDAVSKVDETSRRVKLSTVLGGEDAAARIQPLIKNYQRTNELATQLGFGTRENVIKPLNEAATEIQKLNLQFEILRDRLAVPFTFVLKQINEAAGSSAGRTALGLTAPGLLGRAADAAAAPFRVIDSFLNPARPQGRNLAPDFPLNARQFADGVDGARANTAAGQAAFQNFASGRGGEQSIQFRITRIQQERAELQNKLNQGTLGGASFSSTLSTINRLTTEERTLQEALARLEKARAGATLNFTPGDSLRPRQVPSLFRRAEASRVAQAGGVLGEFQTSESAIAAANPAQAGINDGFSALLLRNEQQQRERILALTQQELSFQTRKLELLAGPGGERAAIEEIAKLKLAALEEEAARSVENFNVRDRQNQIEKERVLALLELDRRRRQEGRDAIGRTFDALISRGSGGLGALVRSVGLSQVRTVAQNVGENLTNSAGGFLGRIGQASGLGGLLRGTLFDPQNAQNPLKAATDQNTAATNANTAALLGVRTSAVTSGTGIAGTASGILSALSGGAPASLNRATTIAAGNRNLQNAGLFSGLPLTTSNKGGFTVGQGVGIAGAGLAGVLGAVNGFKSGGAQGSLTGTASILGAGSAILALSGVSGPAAPILAGIGLALSATAALIGDPKKNRDRALDRLVANAAFSETTPMDFAFNTAGGGFDYNKRGDLRTTPIMLTINALDSRSILERGEDIANAVQGAMVSGHSINRVAQEVVLGF